MKEGKEKMAIRIAEYLKSLRREFNLSAEDLANICEVTVNTIRSIEAGRILLSVDKMLLIYEYFLYEEGVKIDLHELITTEPFINESDKLILEKTKEIHALLVTNEKIGSTPDVN